MAAPRETLAEAPFGCLHAFAIGFLTVAAFTGGFSLLTGADLNLAEEWGAFLFQMLLVAAPFALLAIAEVRGRKSWGVSLALTAVFWGFVLAVAISSRDEGTGANIGLGLLIFVSPIIVAAAGLVTAKITKEL